jgi:hypothetical protein
MSFIERYEAQLVAAGDARRPRRAPTRAIAVVAAIGVLAAGPALAATGVWRPQIGDRDDGSPTISADQPPTAQVERYGVLARPQTDEDRGEATRAALRLIGAGVEGVRTGSIRLLRDSSHGGPAVLIPVSGYHGPFPTALRQDGDDSPRKTDGLCLFVADPSGVGGASACHTPEELLSGAGRLPAMVGNRLYGLAPDGVARVEVDLGDGRTVSAAVEDNLFITAVTHQGIGVDTPGAPTPLAVRWIAADGRVLQRITP